MHFHREQRGVEYFETNTVFFFFGVECGICNIRWEFSFYAPKLECKSSLNSIGFCRISESMKDIKKTISTSSIYFFKINLIVKSVQSSIFEMEDIFLHCQF